MGYESILFNWHFIELGDMMNQYGRLFWRVLGDPSNLWIALFWKHPLFGNFSYNSLHFYKGN